MNETAESYSEDIYWWKVKKPVLRGEKLLIIAALIVAILFDRLIMAGIISLNPDIFIVYYSAFWLGYLVIFYVFNWKRMKYDVVLWIVTACVAALCVWNFIFSGNIVWQFTTENLGNDRYSMITILVIPAVLMAHAQWAAGGYSLRNANGIIPAWFFGWIIKPFSGMPEMARVAGSLSVKGRGATVRHALLGMGVAILLLLIIIPLLMGADQVFSYFLSRMVSSVSPFRFIWHLLTVAVAFVLFYSFLWNAIFGKKKQRAMAQEFRVDTVITSIVLGSIIAVYAIFCVIQFTYLFAGAALPEGLSYLERATYVRQGFAQTVTVCAISVIIYGIILNYGKPNKINKILLSILLVLTGVMLYSGAVRLGLYIDGFGITWLRLISGWFMVYLAAVLVLCTLRLLWLKHLPIFLICALMILVWYVVLGYTNPDNFIVWYNNAFWAGY